MATAASGAERLRAGGFSQRRATVRKVSVSSPRRAVTGSMFAPCCHRLVSSPGNACPLVWMPRSGPSWLVAIMMAEAVMNPEITGWLRKLARKPIRAAAMPSRISPERKASVRTTPV